MSDASGFYLQLFSRRPSCFKTCIATFVLLLVMFLSAGIYMLCRIKTPVSMESLSDGSPSPSESPEDYPSLIHQIWLTDMEIPKPWLEARQHNIDLHPSLTHLLWSSNEIEDFLKKNFPWFLETYWGYPYFNMKVDAARFFIVYHYGGVYIDMDFYVNVSLIDIYRMHGIRQFECVFPETWPSGISTALFACRKQTPFMKLVISNLQRSDHWLVVPYATTMWSTGPMFLSKCLDAYLIHCSSIFVLPYQYFTGQYFTHLHGSTWHRWDANLIKVIYAILTIKLILIVSLLILFVCIIYILYKRQRLVNPFRL